MNSIEGDRSLDPDHEPRKEGGPKPMKQSPSVVEIGGANDGGMQSGPSDDEKPFRKGNHSRSPQRGVQQDMDEYVGSRSLNRDNKGTRSNRKIKPMYPMPSAAGNKGVLKVVQESDSPDHLMPMAIVSP